MAGARGPHRGSIKGIRGSTKEIRGPAGTGGPAPNCKRLLVPGEMHATRVPLQPQVNDGFSEHSQSKKSKNPKPRIDEKLNPSINKEENNEKDTNTKKG